ncbi:MAG: FAD/NAD(P)-binding protein [Pirellulales bacterium]
MTHRARITRIKAEVSGIWTYDLAFEDEAVAASYRFAPGQFNMLYLPGFGESAISVSSDAESAETISHTVRVAGNVTHALARKKVGDEVALRGPFGSAWPIEQCRGQDVVIACGGVGLAPLRPVIYHVIRHRGDFGRVILLYGARTPADLLFTDEYAAWQDADVEVCATVDLGDETWQGDIGVVPILFYRLRLDAPRTRVLTCGPEVMMRFVIFEARARKVEKRHIYISMERNMNCAVGLCGHCQLGPAFVCKDGPVFTYEKMEPYLNLEDF